jgi:hypothetical protein
LQIKLSKEVDADEASESIPDDEDSGSTLVNHTGLSILPEADDEDEDETPASNA